MVWMFIFIEIERFMVMSKHTYTRFSLFTCHSSRCTVVLLLLRSTQLHASLVGYQPQVRIREQHLGLWASVLNRLGGNASEPEEPIADAPLGVYMHGGVGTGKTFMMDLFFQVGGGMPG